MTETEISASVPSHAPAEGVPADVLGVIASHAADARDVASLASAAKETRDAAAAELEERRLKLVALRAKLRSTLLVEEPYAPGAIWAETIEEVQLRRLSDEQEAKEQWSATWMRVLHFDEQAARHKTAGHAVGLGHGFMTVPQEVLDYVAEMEAMSEAALRRADGKRYRNGDTRRFRMRRTFTYVPTSGAIAWDGDEVAQSDEV